MREIQEKQIKQAKRAYIEPFTQKSNISGLQRFSIYLDAGKGLEVLWPVTDYQENSQKPYILQDGENLLRYQVYTTRRTYPAFHFSLSGHGYSKTYDLALMLQEINKKIEVYTIGAGHSPSCVRTGA